MKEHPVLKSDDRSEFSLTLAGGSAGSGHGLLCLNGTLTAVDGIAGPGC